MSFTLQIISKDNVTINLGKVKGWDGDKNSNLTYFGMPGGNVDYQDDDKQGTVVYDALGPTKEFNIESDLAGTFNSLQLSIFKLEALIDGKQDIGSSHTLRSNYVVNDTEYGNSTTPKDIDIHVLRVRHKWVVPGLNKVHITISVVAGR